MATARIPVMEPQLPTDAAAMDTLLEGTFAPVSSHVPATFPAPPSPPPFLETPAVSIEAEFLQRVARKHEAERQAP